MQPNERNAAYPDDNAQRTFAGSPGVESWFLRANHPTEPRALWLKATILVPKPGASRAASSTPSLPGGREDGRGGVAEVWIATFAPEGNTAHRATVPLTDAGFAHDGTLATIRIGGCEFMLGATEGRMRGELAGHRWDLRYAAVPGLGAPLCPYPSRRMIDGGFPKSKLLTPVPVARFSGSVEGSGGRRTISDWIGMQGHNWGKEYAVEYAWGQAVFPGADGAPHAMAEGFTGRVRLGPVVTPRLSALVVRRGEREYRFDGVFAAWRQAAEIGPRRWKLGVSGPAGEALLVMETRSEDMVCLGYVNPDGALSHCLNSKLARVRLRVNPANEEGFECASDHGGALEFLSRNADPSFPEPV